MRRLACALTAAVAVLSLAGCGHDNFRDAKNITSRDADSYTLLNNGDQFPNIIVVCYAGTAFATTTRDLNAVMLVPSLDHTCPAKAGR